MMVYTYISKARLGVLQLKQWFFFIVTLGPAGASFLLFSIAEKNCDLLLILSFSSSRSQLFDPLLVLEFTISDSSPASTRPR